MNRTDSCHCPGGVTFQRGPELSEDPNNLVSYVVCQKAVSAMKKKKEWKLKRDRMVGWDGG